MISRAAIIRASGQSRSRLPGLTRRSVVRPTEMALRRWFAFAVLVACRKDGPPQDRVKPAPPPVVTVGDAAPALPGDPKLVKVPEDIAGKLELALVVKGLARPVQLVAAPGDARKRLFIVEQFEGRIRILENGKLLDKPFFTIDK